MKKVFVLIILILVLAGLWVWQGIYLPKDKTASRETIFTVEPGQGAKEIALNLENQDLIKSSFLFKVYVALSGDANRLQAGSYELSPSMAVPEIVSKIVKGEIAKIKVTIPEGLTMGEIEERIKSKVKSPRTIAFGELRGRQKSKLQFKIQNFKISEFQNEFNFLKNAPGEAILEGFLFPDTYEIFPSASSEDIARKMLQNFDEKLTPDLRAEIERQQKTIFEIVTMASLIEKEVPRPEDKKLVSGILWKRLEIGMPLQVDATITYITGKKTTKVSREETKIDSPYNTYKYSGLPIGPICNPGLESIRAAVYPRTSDYFYYLSTPEGRTIFSKTLQEHNIAKAKYLK